MKQTTCRQLGGPCEATLLGDSADDVIKAQDAHLKDMVEQGDASHVPARDEMKGRWKRPLSGMKWYREVKRAFAALPEDSPAPH